MNLEFKITCKGLVIARVINDESLSLKLLVILLRELKSITKRIEKDIKIYGLNPTEFAVLKLLYSKGDQPIQKLEDKTLLASSSITYVVNRLEKKR
ncbi:MarR family transcriptional regulator [Bacillus toyonensis]|nr:MarR family transcriptional regulator [Bacillus toyonensis]MBJ8130431.1 MarR family transcriptional regulator [Bacillus cereus group sp. N3]MBE7168635.1 MarR family transcriptional regulator [Bacillus toyonensis]PEB28536.1 MarR family transcriptional regulator [Bacillus toyonensis]PED76740.1 MarR family transcriptional regulator [Bacillus toyonensis]